MRIYAMPCMENAANQNTVKLLYIHWYYIQPFNHAPRVIVLTSLFSTPWTVIKQFCNALSLFAMVYLSCCLYFLSIHSRLKSPVRTEKMQETRGIYGNTLSVHAYPTERWKTIWKFYHTVDQSEQTTISRQSSQTSWEAVHRY